MLDSTTTQLLDHLHRGGDFFSYWWVLEGRQSFWWQAGKRTPLPEGSHNMYFGVHPAVSIPTERKSKKTGKPYRPDPKQTRPILEEIAAVNCILADIDAKEYGGDKNKARAHVDSLVPRPSVIIDSGGGYHLYWLFVQPWILGTPEERTNARKLQAAWVRYVESDPQSKDLVRVLRVPGTYNHKYNPPRTVEIVDADFTRLYDPAELAPHCAHLMESDTLPQAVANGAGAETDIEWARNVLGRAVAMVVASTDGKKHGGLLKAATLAGGIAHLISETEIETTLYNAIKDRANDPINARKTILDGIAYGKQKPLKQDESPQGYRITKQRRQSPDSTAPESWAPPLPFIHHDLPTFPVDTLTPWLREYVIAETEAKQTPLDLAAMLALSVLSTACARYVMVEAKPGWVEPVNLYTVTALPPASRKSPMFSAMVAPINAYERELISQASSDIALRQAEHDILEARLQAAKREAAQAKTKPEQSSAMDKVAALAHELAHHNVPALPRYIVDDITTEMLSSMLAEHGRIAALSPEGDIFSIMSGRYSGDASPNFGVYLKAHAGDTLRVDRRGRPSEFVEWPALTMGLTVQPDVIRGFGDKRSMRGLGLLGRFLYALPESTVGHRKINPDPVPHELRQQYLDRMTYLLRQVPVLAATYSGNNGNCGNKDKVSRVSPGRREDDNCGDSDNSGVSTLFTTYLSIYLLQLAPAARQLLEDWQAWLEPHLAEHGEYGAFADWSGKLSGEILRIAGLLYLSDYAAHNSHNSHNTISADVIARAITIGQYMIPHARAAFIEMGTDPAIHAARRVLSWIEHAQPHEFTKRDAYQATKGTFKHASDLDPVLELLTYHSYIRPIEMDERSGPGRKPSQRYEVNPLTFAEPLAQNQIKTAPFVVPTIMPVATNGVHVTPIQNGHLATPGTPADTAKTKAIDTALKRGEYNMARGYANGIQDTETKQAQLQRIDHHRQEHGQ